MFHAITAPPCVMHQRTRPFVVCPPGPPLKQTHTTDHNIDARDRDVGKNTYANVCFDEFLSSKEEARWTEGIERLRPELRGIAMATLAVDRDAVAAGGRATGESPGAADGAASAGTAGVGTTGATATTGPRLGSLRGLGAAARAEDDQEGDEEEDEDEDDLRDMEHHNEYLQRKPVCSNAWKGCAEIVCVAPPESGVVAVHYLVWLQEPLMSLALFPPTVWAGVYVFRVACLFRLW